MRAVDADFPLRTAARFDLPPLTRDARGSIRRVGVEVEFMGLGVRSAARALAAAFGGTPSEEDPHAVHVLDTSIGRLTVELDIRDVHPQRHEAMPRIRLGAAGAAWLGSALGPVVPRELITAPVPIDGLAVVDRAVDVLRRAGARGRGTTLFGSLGLHFNVDPPDLDAETITAVLKAFLLLHPGPERGTAGWARFLPQPFPDSYVRRVVAPDYWPDMATLAGDYLAANPTRDRALDLLPLFLHTDHGRIRTTLPYEKIKGRAVFHYRLPRAHVGDPAWSIAPDWNRWVAVETLAHDRERLEAFGRAAAA